MVTPVKRIKMCPLDVTAKADSGDLVEACQTRIARWEDILPLEKIVAEGVPQPRPKRIFFQSNGIADEDLAVGKYALDQAKRKKLKLQRAKEIRKGDTALRESINPLDIAHPAQLFGWLFSPSVLSLKIYTIADRSPPCGSILTDVMQNQIIRFHEKNKIFSDCRPQATGKRRAAGAFHGTGKPGHFGDRSGSLFFRTARQGLLPWRDLCDRARRRAGL